MAATASAPPDDSPYLPPEPNRRRKRSRFCLHGYVFARILLKAVFAMRAAEVVHDALKLEHRRGGASIDAHVTDWIFDHCGFQLCRGGLSMQCAPAPNGNNLRYDAQSNLLESPHRDIQA